MADTAQQPQSTVERYRKRRDALRSQFDQWKPHLQEINDYVLPRARFQPLAEANQGGNKKYMAQINNAPLYAIRTATAGMMSGLTPPWLPWKRLTVADKDLAEFPRVRDWLYLVNERQLALYLKSNTYQCLTANYFDSLAFGTTLTILDEDDRTVMRGYHTPVGSYVLACNKRGKVDTAIRDVVMTVRQMVQKFGLKAVSKNVREKWDRSSYDDRVEVSHAIEPNEGYRPGSLRAREKPFSSCWWESKADDKDAILSESGLSENRILAPRWMVLGDDTYGTSCPGMEMLGDAKALQAYEKEKARCIEMLSGPPTAVPHGMTGVSLQPRKIINLPVNGGKEQAYPIITIPPGSIEAIRQEIAGIERRCNRVSYADLWLTLTMNDPGSRQRTAEEIRAVVEEKIVQVAPVLLRYNEELFDPLDEASFAIMWRAGMIPEPPPELQGQELKVEYVSPLHTAQQYAKLGGTERLAAFVTSIIGWAPEAKLAVKIKEWIDQYASTLGLPPNMVADDEEFAKAMAAARKQQEAVAAAHAAQIVPDAIQKLGNTPLDGNTALQRVAEVAGAQGPVARA